MAAPSWPSQVLGVSIDNEYVHLAWRREKEELESLSFPMLSDIERELSIALGILDAEGAFCRVRLTLLIRSP